MLVSSDYSMKTRTRKTVQEQLPENISELGGRMCQDFRNPRRYAGDLREMAPRRNQLKMKEEYDIHDHHNTNMTPR